MLRIKSVPNLQEVSVKIRAMITVKGLVQGVNFRYYTQQTALLHNVSGWVRNLPDGRVAGCFEGEEQDVRAAIDQCRKGPARARVDEVQVEIGEFCGEFTGFEIRR
jgi:acylphosphatase